MLIVFEGMDGCGKHTHLKLIRKWLETIGSPTSQVFVEDEPTMETAAGQELHRLLENKAGEPGIDSLDQESILELYLEDRLTHSQKLRNLSDQGIVLASRYDLSTYAYQSLHLMDDEMQGFFENTYARHRYREKAGCLIPDLTLFLSLSEEVAMTRIEKRGEVSGFEKLKVLRKVKGNYRAAIEYLGKKDGRKIVVLEAGKGVDEVFTEVKSAIEKSMIGLYV